MRNLNKKLGMREEEKKSLNIVGSNRNSVVRLKRMLGEEMKKNPIPGKANVRYPGNVRRDKMRNKTPTHGRREPLNQFKSINHQNPNNNNNMPSISKDTKDRKYTRFSFNHHVNTNINHNINITPSPQFTKCSNSFLGGENEAPRGMKRNPSLKGRVICNNFYINISEENKHINPQNQLNPNSNNPNYKKISLRNSKAKQSDKAISDIHNVNKNLIGNSPQRIGKTEQETVMKNGANVQVVELDSDAKVHNDDFQKEECFNQVTVFKHYSRNGVIRQHTSVDTIGDSGCSPYNEGCDVNHNNRFLYQRVKKSIEGNIIQPEGINDVFQNNLQLYQIQKNNEYNKIKPNHVNPHQIHHIHEEINKQIKCENMNPLHHIQKTEENEDNYCLGNIYNGQNHIQNLKNLDYSFEDENISNSKIYDEATTKKLKLENNKGEGEGEGENNPFDPTNQIFSFIYENEKNFHFQALGKNELLEHTQKLDFSKLGISIEELNLLNSKEQDNGINENKHDGADSEHNLNLPTSPSPESEVHTNINTPRVPSHNQSGDVTQRESVRQLRDSNYSNKDCLANKPPFTPSPRKDPLLVVCDNPPQPISNLNQRESGDNKIQHKPFRIKKVVNRASSAARKTNKPLNIQTDQLSFDKRNSKSIRYKLNSKLIKQQIGELPQHSSPSNNKVYK